VWGKTKKKTVQGGGIEVNAGNLDSSRIMGSGGGLAGVVREKGDGERQTNRKRFWGVERNEVNLWVS